MGPTVQRLYWLAIAMLLTAHFSGVALAMALALLTSALQTVHALAVHRHWRHLAVQVRAAYLALLLIGQWPALWPLPVLQFAGTSALLVADYCLLARLLLLLPWNRREPVSADLVRRLLLTPPAPGAITGRVLAPAGLTAAVGDGGHRPKSRHHHHLQHLAVGLQPGAVGGAGEDLEHAASIGGYRDEPLVGRRVIVAEEGPAAVVATVVGDCVDAALVGRSGDHAQRPAGDGGGRGRGDAHRGRQVVPVLVTDADPDAAAAADE